MVVQNNTSRSYGCLMTEGIIKLTFIHEDWLMVPTGLQWDSVSAWEYTYHHLFFYIYSQPEKMFFCWNLSWYLFSLIYFAIKECPILLYLIIWQCHPKMRGKLLQIFFAICAELVESSLWCQSRSAISIYGVCEVRSGIGQLHIWRSRWWSSCLHVWLSRVSWPYMERDMRRDRQTDGFHTKLRPDGCNNPLHKSNLNILKDALLLNKYNLGGISLTI